MPIKRPMNTGIKDGKLVIDMAEADELWESLSQDQQYEAMCIMFQPLLDQATKMKSALTQIAAMADPDDMEVNDNGLTEWGCELPDAIAMSYENCITIAQIALGDAASS